MLKDDAMVLIVAAEKREQRGMNAISADDLTQIWRC